MSADDATQATHAGHQVVLPRHAWDQLERVGTVLDMTPAEVAAMVLEALACSVGTQVVLDAGGVRVCVPSFVLGIPTLAHPGDETKRTRLRPDALEGEVLPV
jgi:hypothetical protein